MSFLAPLYALGLLAVAGPVIFHLIRRRPKGQVPFSSVMFLTPSPPPPTSRRRFDQILLLLLRAAVLVLLGLAFMRPFFREDASAAPTEASRRVVLLVDTSASMRRGDLWKRAVANADAALGECKPTDRVAVYAFDRTVRPVMTFTESDQLEPHQRSAVARDRLAKLTPSWGSTELGRALVDGASAILEAGAAEKATPGKVVLVSDLQQGARLTELAGFEWPADVELELRTVTDDSGNAGLTLLAERVEVDANGKQAPFRVRVANDAGAKQEQFRLAWQGVASAEIDAYVPPGESRVIKVPRPSATGPAPVLRLTGDAHDFDNTLYFSGPQRQELTVFFVGADAADDPAGLLFFLARAWEETPERLVRVVARKPTDPLTWDEVQRLPLVVLAGDPSPDSVQVLDRYIREGGVVLAVLSGTTKTLPTLVGVTPQPIEEAKGDRYAMLRDVAFDHPLFAPLSGPQFGDFTKVHFWKHRRLTELPGAKVLARFDDGDPAVLEKSAGRGRLVVFASGWQPSDSQLSRSSKFVPLLTALLELRGGRTAVGVNYRIGDRVPMSPSEAATVRKPDGKVVALAAGTTEFTDTDQPGAYVIETPAGSRSFAVNLDPSESLTAAVPVETLEQLGVRLVKRDADVKRTEAERQQRNAELERSQGLWRVLILIAIVLLLVETGLAGLRTRSGRREVVTP